MKTCLTIAGSDCSGGAGLQADLKTFAAHGHFGMSVVVSVVAENTHEVRSVFDMSPVAIRDQIDCVMTDIPPDAIKVGMLSSNECMLAVADGLAAYHTANVVVDPVMIAKHGAALMQSDALATFRSRIYPLASLLTPNIPEAETLLERNIHDVEDMKDAAKALAEAAQSAVLVKGGHFDGEPLDVLFDGSNITTYTTQRIHTKNTHGTGCTLSSAIASQLAHGVPMAKAVHAAKAYVTTAIRHAMDLGAGNGPTHHFYRLYEEGLDWLNTPLEDR